MGTILKRYNGTAWVPVELDASSVGGYTPSELLNYDNLTNAPEKVSFVLRDTISSDTANTLKEIEINGEKWKIEGGSSSGSADVTADMVSIDPDSTLHSAENVQDAISYIKDDLIEHLLYKSQTDFMSDTLWSEDVIEIYYDSDTSNTLKEFSFDINTGRGGDNIIISITKYFRNSGYNQTISFNSLEKEKDYVLKMITPSTVILLDASTNAIVGIKSFTLGFASYPLVSVEIMIEDAGGSGEYEINGCVTYTKYTMLDG